MGGVIRTDFVDGCVLEAGPDVVRVRVAAGAGKAIEDAIYLAAPEVASLEIEELHDPPRSAFVPLESLVARPRA